MSGSRLADALGPATGARHSRDTGLTNGVSYYYKLEDVEGTGRTVLHGPVSATPQAGAADASSSSEEEVSSDASSTDSASPARITYGDPSSVGLRVVRQGAQGLELELQTAGFYATAESDGSVRLEIPGFEVAGAPGSPALPVKRSFLEALAGRQVKIAAVVPEDVVSFSSLRPALAELPSWWCRDGTLRAGAASAFGARWVYRCGRPR
jgi:hypothetical protein